MNFKSIVIIIVLSVIVLTSLIILPSDSMAEDNIGLYIMPAKIEIRAKPGDRIKRQIFIKNKGTKRVKINFQANDYFVKPNGKFVFLPKGDKSYSCSTWLKVTPSIFKLKPNQSKKVIMYVNIPQKVEPGDHWGAVIFKAKSGRKKHGQVISSLVSLVFVTLPGNIKRELLLEDLSLQESLSSNRGWGQLKLVNSGNVHVTIKGMIYINKKSGETVTGRSIGTITILPSSHRFIYVPLKKVPIIGVYDLVAQVDYGPNLYSYNQRRKKSRSIIIFPELILLSVLIPQIFVSYWVLKKKIIN